VPPGLPGDISRGGGGGGGGSSKKPASAKRQLGFLVAVAAVIVAAGATAVVLLLSHHSPSHSLAGGTKPSSAPAHHHPSTAPTTSSKPPPLALTGAHGRLGVPSAVGPLQLNPGLTSKYVGPSMRSQDAKAFLIPGSDVVSGFYTPSSTATTFTTKDPRLMFLVYYLSGAGNAKTSVHSFMTDSDFTHQQQISAGKLGGEAACGLLREKKEPAVAHCMWADGNTYADFYAWDSTPSALAQTMIGIRPQVELKP
jgi:hypothetical protein